MKLTIASIALLFSFLSFAQNDEFQVWTEAGISGKLIKKKSDWSVEMTSRFDNQGLATFFPQVGVDYKITKWLKPSLEYRFIVDRNKYGNYKPSHRINVNVKLDESFKRLTYSLRLRYQSAFISPGANSNYDSDFDQAFRFKPELSYDIKKFFLTPEMSAEFFYNPKFGEDGRQFDRVRFAIGAKVDVKSDHGFSFKYQLDKKLNAYNKGMRHVLSLSYKYSL